MKVVSRISFNTRRMYSAEGQVITAELCDDGTVLFDDSSRHIWGEFQVKDLDFVLEWWPKHPDAFARGVMRRYDANDYRMGRNGIRREDTVHNFPM